ncbi:Neuronal acetylcholine receptor subunit alpha-7,Acetylcholine receptor subunit alpha-1-A,Neuronal acetylcholine receptor subunit alpha-4,Acetylcholine receptor subunit alpha-like,Neuronal acetylcholine receptor subunit alpha-2,Acetylcholine receptor subunit alpha-L1,Acetylcholine receptor subunit alpha-like 1,CHRNA7-FAM7A fusion protein,Acetylcholine receptor subunit alpha [Lepeophtheirus salmonis]|uniref:Neurotransmitter-gated ion-channel ligand-binding domain-containing protein n=1 Tax=Lepeophtheirus salmonis TaxID=72036 RepID=A0A7R8HCP7_LEPSM|nr:Neuronal acetylcholine receptor subunit alpha-7,Acetylcholine receptor subunit alpha-1-A,Neuronal acetylcholine receptor subunit alpha-4,Acetylcholine receptor subunit alpha-like,Neuronal acetylcholine receptor subunit alpha-2,Acetylcholine receptor subunit alpha-L1,Acetylcholine receptor subunit alpha-like 1,CHRNA7-FAM7A fusion protein,Acetylcholine receptor subunit alpha [Lepeophtheirus salmonis]CAF3008932.1 Neuronal acetylcholine receptor subunit alpha-7,Acetylcholine receptor subunit alpha-
MGDEMLIWNPKDYYNITKIRIPCDRIWLPDIVLYNNADDFSTEYMRISLNMSGRCCFLSFFDDQICMLKLGSWIHDGFSVDVTNRTFEVDLSNYLPNGEWTLLEKPKLVRSERYYPCCIEPFPEITISLRMRRKTLYYMYNIVFPCMMMSTLTVLVFCLPPDSGEKNCPRSHGNNLH